MRGRTQTGGAWRAVFSSLRFLLVLWAVCTVAVAETLREAADGVGVLVGAALHRDFIVDPDSISPEYRRIAATEFNVYVAENCFKMASLLRDRPADPFAIRVEDLHTRPIDSLVAIARENGVKRIRGHALIWHDSMPAWLRDEVAEWDSGQVLAFAESYITAVLGYCRRHAPVIYEWDVINEILTADGFRKGTWYDAVGDKQAFIDACFRTARAADPEDRLIYNDYGIELHGPAHGKTNRMLEMARGMVGRGVPIDGIGLQAHFTGPDAGGAGGFSEAAATAFGQTFAKLAELGLDGIVTELDLRLPTDQDDSEGGVTAVQLAMQGEQYERIVATALAQPNCPGVLIWGISDARSWVPRFFVGMGHALPFDAAYRKKPAYHGVRTAIEHAPARGGIIDPRR